jgi:uncharacterized protein YhjY with autotransporter beta-barrel domain
VNIINGEYCSEPDSIDSAQTSGNKLSMRLLPRGELKKVSFSLPGCWITLISLILIQNANCQTLDEIQAYLLNDSCQALKGNTFAQEVYFDDNAGSQLKRLCDPATGGGVQPGGVTASSGGGAASTQNQFVAIARRLAKARQAENEEQNGSGAGDEVSTELGNGLNLFLSGQFEGLDRTTTRYETGYKSNVNGVTGGMDYRFHDWLVSGVAVNYTYWDGNFNNAGGFQNNTIQPIIYLSILPTEKIFIDITAEYGHQWRDKSRLTSFFDANNIRHNASGLVSSNYQANNYGVNVLTGYDFSKGSFTVGPRLRFRYSELATQGYTEAGNTGLELRLLSDKVTSLQTSVGLQASAAFSTAIGVLIPQITADWTHEFENDQRLISAQFAQDGRAIPTTFQFLSDKPDRDFFHIGTGLGVMLPHGVQPFINFEALLGNRLFNNFVGTVGIRLEL